MTTARPIHRGGSGANSWLRDYFGLIVVMMLIPNERGGTPTIKFHGVEDEYGCFSNFAPYQIKLNGKIWPTSEHYFQAQKFAGTEHEDAIRNASTPMIAAQMGRDRTRQVRPDWEGVKDEIMLEAVRAKFDQHAQIASVLLDTGDAMLVEHAARDSYWGDGGHGRGRNMLGQILMRIREELRRGVDQF